MKSILVIDDDERILRLLRTVLESAGYAVSTASDGEEALQATCDRHTYDCIIVDINLPRWSGDQVIEILDLEGTDTKIIVVTGDPVSDRANELRTNPCVFKVIAKPFPCDLIINAVNRALKGELPVERECNTQC